jgi:hypothetical protein
MRLEGLFDLLRVFLGNTLFENLWQRLDKLFCLDTTVHTQQREGKERWELVCEGERFFFAYLPLRTRGCA